MTKHDNNVSVTIERTEGSAASPIDLMDALCQAANEAGVRIAVSQPVNSANVTYKGPRGVYMAVLPFRSGIRDEWFVNERMRPLGEWVHK